LKTRQKRERSKEVADTIIAGNGVNDIPALMADVEKRLLRSHGVKMVEAAEQKLTNNVTVLCTEMKGNHGRGGVIARLSEGISTPEMAKIAACSERTVQRAKKDMKENPARDVRFKQRPKLKRLRVPLTERIATIAWIHDQCPTKSGTAYRIQWCRSQKLYEEYKKAVKKEIKWPGREEEVKPRGIKWLRKLKVEAKVRVVRTYFGQFHCIRCNEAAAAKRRADAARKKFAERDEGKRVLTEEEEEEAAIAVEEEKPKMDHYQLRWAQAGYLKHVRFEAIQTNPNRVLVTMDFSKYNLKQNITRTAEQKKCQPEFMHAMIMVIEHKKRAAAAEAEAAGDEEKESKEEKKETKTKKKRRSSEKWKGADDREVRYIDYGTLITW